MSKRAFITGITGQGGSYLAEILLEKGYKVYGIQRRSSTIITERIDHLLEIGAIETYYGDLTESDSLVKLLYKIQPDEVYNLGAQSNVAVSFEIPEYTANVTALGVLRMLEALRILGLKETKFIQSSSSEMFGISPPPQNEDTPMMPQSPYGISKVFGYHTVREYRTGYGMFACNGILFNQDSPRRTHTAVTQKICREAARIKMGFAKEIRLGNLDSKRDWGFSKDYSEALWMIMQYKEPEDFVIASEEQHTVKEFAEIVFEKLGLNFYDYVVFDKKFVRPNEVPSLLGDSNKARKLLGWKPKVGFNQLIDMMLENAMEKIKNAQYLGQRGFACDIK